MSLRLSRRSAAAAASACSRPLWLIDLDNTLHDASWTLMGEINRRMTRYIVDQLGVDEAEASALRQTYWHRYGATLLGMVRHQGTDPHDFLAKTHPAPDELAAFLKFERGLASRIARLRGERWLLTNAPRVYTHRLLESMRIARLFDRLICIEDMRAMGQLRPKPSTWLWRRLIQIADRAPSQITLIDDSAENLLGAHRAGMRTARVWVSKTLRDRTRAQLRPVSIRRPHYVHHQVNSLSALVRLP